MTTNQTTSQAEKILVAIDSDGKSAATIDYVGRVAAGNDKLTLCLYSRIPGLPPELREHEGSEDPDREQALSDVLSEKVDAWRGQKQAESHPVLEAAQHKLIAAGVSKDAIKLESSWDASMGESLAEALSRVARQTGCQTIAIGRQPLSGLRELTHHHTSDALLHAGTGLALWIVE
jgi:nucleotide-binding universal stress UspA family protein